MSKLPLRVGLTSSSQPRGGNSQGEEEFCPPPPPLPVIETGVPGLQSGLILQAWVGQPWLQCTCLRCLEL